MPKMHSHSGTKKRLTKTGSGKVVRGQAGTSHLAPGTTQKQTRQLRKKALVCTADLRHNRQIIANIK
ncbi:MAG: 50S ribosomal protein L35 [Bacilli bacterium]|jgi:large subunit ribosomal protein L35|nr:50S ribosomal protein L35 [Bacilli bacterium]